MKNLKIKANDEKISWSELTRKTIKRGIASIIIISFLLKVLFSRSYEIASNYERVVKNYTDETNKVQSHESFLSCLKEFADGRKFQNQNQNSSELAVSIDKYIQEKKINIYNLDVYLLDKETGQGKEWRLLTWKEIWRENLAKGLFINNLTKLTLFLQSFFPKGIKNKEWFSFYSELLIKTSIFYLLLNILQERQDISTRSPGDFESQEESSLFKSSIEIAYMIFTIIPWGVSFISLLPPSKIQNVSFFEWVIIYIFVILSSVWIEEYTRTNESSSDKETRIFLRDGFKLRIFAEILQLALFGLYNGWNYGWRSIYQKPQGSRGLTAIIGRLLFLTNRFFYCVLKLEKHYRDKLRTRINEKAL